jgi:hypothetical protein
LQAIEKTIRDIGVDRFVQRIRPIIPRQREQFGGRLSKRQRTDIASSIRLKQRLSPGRSRMGVSRGVQLITPDLAPRGRGVSKSERGLLRDRLAAGPLRLSNHKHGRFSLVGASRTGVCVSGQPRNGRQRPPGCVW